MITTRRPHTRAFFSWLLVLVSLVLAAGRLIIPGQSDAQEQLSTSMNLGGTTEIIDGVVHTVDHYVGAPVDRSIGDQLDALGIAAAIEDRVTAFPNPALGLGSTITIERASIVDITDWGTSTTVRTWAPTVESLLQQLQISLGNQDQMSVDKETTIVDKMTITIKRVEVTTVQETEQIAFSKTTVDDSAMEKGQKKLLQAGQNGIRTKTYQLRRENGLEVEKTLVSSDITQQPVAEEMAVGTHVTLYGTGKATWYGLRHGYGAAHNTLPFGTKVRVVNVTNGNSVVVTIDDRGIQGSAIIDLNAEAFEEIAPLGQGVANVRLEKIYSD